jgi:hypothetical protein
MATDCNAKLELATSPNAIGQKADIPAIKRPWNDSKLMW